MYTTLIEYLYSKYALWTPPSEFLRWASDVVIAPVLGPIYGYLAPLQAKWSYNGEGNEYEYASAVAEAKAEIYDEISSRPVVICEFFRPDVIGIRMRCHSIRPFSLIFSPFHWISKTKTKRHVRILAVLLGGSRIIEEDRDRSRGGIAREGMDPRPPDEAGEEGRAPGDYRPILVAERLRRREEHRGAVFRHAGARARAGTGRSVDRGRGGGTGDASHIMNGEGFFR